MVLALERCEGTTTDPDGYRVRYAVQDAAGFGRRSSVFRRTATQATGTDHWSEVYVQQGRVLLDAWAQRDGRRPAIAPVLRLARSTLDRLS